MQPIRLNGNKLMLSCVIFYGIPLTDLFLQLFWPFETCYEVWKEAAECYANDIQCCHDPMSNRGALL